MDKSYIIIYHGDIASALRSRGLNNFIILNSRLLVLYVPLLFDSEILRDIYQISWFSVSVPMSSMIEIKNNLEFGVSAIDVSGAAYVYNKPYNVTTGKGILIAIIDSGISYLNPDLRKEDGTSKIFSIWDQEGITNPPPDRYLFGSEFSNQEINDAIARNDPNISIDYTGTGTMAAGIAVGSGNVDSKYKGIAEDAELVVVKLRSYPGVYYVEKKNYTSSDFLAAFSYVINIAKREQRSLVINLSVAARSAYGYFTILGTFEELKYPGIIVVSGAGNQRDTYKHYSGKLKDSTDVNDVVVEYDYGQNLDIFVQGSGLDRFSVKMISPSGESSYTATYFPEYYEHRGKFNLEDTVYIIRFYYPWLASESEIIIISLLNMKSGAWTVRVTPEIYLDGQYEVYLPNSNLLSDYDGLIDSDSYSTITLFGLDNDTITVGAYDNTFGGIWVGSSKGPSKTDNIKPDVVAPGVNIVSTFGNSGYRTGTGTGISSTITAGLVALIMEYIKNESQTPRLLLYPQVIKTYFMSSAYRSDIYNYPNFSLGYGLIDFKKTILEISNNL